MTRWTTMMAACVAAAVAAATLAGCGGSAAPGGGGAASDGANSTAGSATIVARFVDYARCMRGHGVSDFPDPTTSPGGGVSFAYSAGPGSDLDRSSPVFQAANRACGALLPGGERPPALSAQRIAAEVRWAACMRAHGVPGFPDPNSQGVFDSARFDEGSPAFATASKACTLLQPSGPTPVGPGPRGS